MAINTFPATSADKTRRVITLTSGTSWTVPTGVTFVNATLIGGGGGGGAGGFNGSVTTSGTPGNGGTVVESTVNTTPGSSISYSIGAGGSGGWFSYGYGSSWAGSGGTTTFTGATSASGGAYGLNGQQGYTTVPTGSPYLTTTNGGGAATGRDTYGGTGGSGCIILEYWA